MTDEQISIKKALALQSMHNSMWAPQFERAQFLEDLLSEMAIGQLAGVFHKQAERCFEEIDKAKACTISEQQF